MKKNKEFTENFYSVYPTLYRSLNSLFSSKILGGMSNINLGFDKKTGIICSVQLSSLPSPLSLEDMEHKGNLACIHDSKCLMMKNYFVSVLFPENKHINYFVCELHELDMMRLKIDEFVNAAVLILSFININKIDATSTDKGSMTVKLCHGSNYVSMQFPLDSDYLLSKYVRKDENIQQEGQRSQTSAMGGI